MPIQIACDCGKRLRVKDELAGKKVRCPGCQAVFPVPVPAAVAADPQTGAPAPRPPDRAPSVRPRAEPAGGAGARRPSAPRPRRQLVLRCFVLVLGLLGGALASLLGFVSYRNTHDPLQRESIELERTLVQAAEKTKVEDAHVKELRDDVNRFDRLGYLCYCMLATGVLGVAGGVLALLRLGKVAAPLMILPAAVTGALFVPSLILTSPLILGGLLGLLVRRTPRVRPA